MAENSEPLYEKHEKAQQSAQSCGVPEQLTEVGMQDVDGTPDSFTIGEASPQYQPQRYPDLSRLEMP